MHPSPAMNLPQQTESTRAHILVVDHAGDCRTMLQRVLETRHHVTCVEGIHPALALLEDTVFDVVILDMVRHGADSLTLLENIRRTPKTRELPVLLVTALIDMPIVSRGLKMGANDYVTHPIDTHALLTRLDTQLTLKRLHDEREAALLKLDEAEAMRNRLFRVATHDLKNPLANIRMAEYVLREAVSDDPVAGSMMDTVTASLDSMQEVIDDFMNAVILQSGQMEMSIRPVSIERAVYRTLLQYNVNAEKKAITVVADHVDGEVQADESRLSQIVTNLVSNAIKFSPQGSKVVIMTEKRGDNLRLSVSDEGPGIPDNEQHLLFTEFGRLSPRPTGQESSTGLGLWIVKTLVEMMGGRVGLKTPAAGGAVFWVELPLAEETNLDTRQPIIHFPGGG